MFMRLLCALSLFGAVAALAQDAAVSTPAQQPEFAGTDRPGPSEREELPLLSAGDQLLKAPAFSLKDLAGERLDLSKVEAPVTILYFWTKSRQCEDDLKLLQSLHEKYGDKGVRIVGLAYNSGPSREDVRRFTEGLGVTFPQLMCTYDVAQRYDVATYPTTFALDGEHHIRYWMYGIMVREHWDALIDEMLNTQPATVRRPE